MAPCVWALPASGTAGVFRALEDCGLRVESYAGDASDPEPRFQVCHGRARQIFWIREMPLIRQLPESPGELQAFYRLTWPWRWPAEARLFGTFCRTLDRTCERLI
jgi:hypothetical protein